MDALRRHRGDLLALAVVTAIVLGPYLGLGLGTKVLVTDDVFTSDVWSAGIPGRASLGRIVRGGEWPLWEPGILGGVPAAGASSDPFTLVACALLPPHVAYGLPLLCWLASMCAGTFLLARRFGAARPGAALAALVFPLSGAVVTHFKHLEIVATESWFPWALLALEAAAGAEERRARVRNLAIFGLVFGLQVLAGFAQTAYFAGLVYVAWAGFRCLSALRRDRRRGVELALLFGTACLLAVGVGALSLLPTAEIARASPRQEGVAFAFASQHAFWLPDLWTFLSPAANGSAADGTYAGTGVFWEDYAYAGLATLVLAPLGAWATRKEPRTWALAAIGVVALLLVLGPATPLFRLAFDFVPGMGRFRLPTRFLFVVELVLALLAARGLTWLAGAVRVPRLAWLVGAGVVASTAVDLLVAQTPQNALADAASWMSPPATVAGIPNDSEPFRIYTPLPRTLHERAFVAARGWSDLAPYHLLRDAIEPNTNLLWGLDAGSGYDVLAPRWSADYWGDFGVPGAVANRARLAGDELEFRPSWLRLLALANVRYVVSAWPVATPRLEVVQRGPVVTVYRLSESLPRAWVARRTRLAATDAEAVKELTATDFVPGEDVVLPPGSEAASEGGEARITARTANTVTMHTRGAGWVVLAETWFPGWSATVDGVETEVVRANLWQRAVRTGPGEHDIRYRFDPPAARWGRWISSISLVILVAAMVLTRRSRAFAGATAR